MRGAAYMHDGQVEGLEERLGKCPVRSNVAQQRMQDLQALRPRQHLGQCGTRLLPCMLRTSSEILRSSCLMPHRMESTISFCDGGGTSNSALKQCLAAHTVRGAAVQNKRRAKAGALVQRLNQPVKLQPVVGIVCEVLCDHVQRAAERCIQDEAHVRRHLVLRRACEP